MQREGGRVRDAPVVLVREVQESTGHATLLEDVEERQALRDGEAVVQVVVDDEMGRAELEDALGFRGVPAAVVLASAPEGTVELLEAGWLAYVDIGKEMEGGSSRHAP